MFEEDVASSYQDFVQKAAFCRNMTWEQAHAVAQGRVWKGADARKIGLVDVEGGVWRAVEVAKKLAKIPDKRGVTLCTVKGQRRLFGGGRSNEGEETVSPSSAASLSTLNMGRPLMLADDSVGDYMGMIGASVPGTQPWTQSLGLIGGLALQQLLNPVIANVDQEMRRRSPLLDLFLGAGRE